MTQEEIFQTIVKQRGIADVDSFINPKYEDLHDPSKLPDITNAVKRIKQARDKREKIVIYGDYDIDGLTATTLLLDAFKSFGIKAEGYIPDRFAEGYGMSEKGVQAVKDIGADLILTVDCGSRSINEIKFAKTLGLDVIVTDHHEVGEALPEAVAVVNPKREDSKYPWRDLAGVGVAFKLVCALQKEIDGLDEGQEKWLLDLVALGTVCDVVELLDENRTIVWWGLKVMAKTRRPGIRALAEVSGTDLAKIKADDLGFRIGPRLNSAGRLEHAKKSLEILSTDDENYAESIADELNGMNQKRQSDQKRITTDAFEQAEDQKDNPVLVLAGENWSHGVVGIVASTIVEKFKKPAFVMQKMGDTTKGSGRSFGDYHLANALKTMPELLISGGGHKYAAGATIKTKDFNKFAQNLNHFYAKQKIKNQEKYIEPSADIEVKDLQAISIETVAELGQLEPFGRGNEEPLFEATLTLDNWRPVGADQTHAKASFTDENGHRLDGIGFRKAEDMPESGSSVKVWFHAQINEFNGHTNVQANIIKITTSN